MSTRPTSSFSTISKSESPMLSIDTRKHTYGPLNQSIMIPHVTVPATTSITSSRGHLEISSKQVREVVDFCWNKENTETAYQPQHVNVAVFESLSDEHKAALSQYFDLVSLQGQKAFHDGSFRKQVEMLLANTQTVTHIVEGIEECIECYLRPATFNSSNSKKSMAHELHNMLIAVGWMEKYWMFTDLHLKKSKQADSFIPALIAKPYITLSYLFGNHAEFTYYGHYVGASCSNMQECRDLMQAVDFNSPQSIATWVQHFQPLYSFQSNTSENSNAYTSELYFRFIHLAMEMVFSHNIAKANGRFENALSATLSKEDRNEEIRKGLEIIHQIEVQQNAVFKTLKIGSDPKLYNSHIRPYIAGTWGKNCGTVFHDKGKFFDGVSYTHVTPETLDKSHSNTVMNEITNEITSTSTADGSLMLPLNTIGTGLWKQHVGQTGAGTTVRPICDEYSGGVSDLYISEVPAELVWALMRDDLHMVKKIELEHNPLQFMLTSFRAISRPYSHNVQILTAKAYMDRLKPHIVLDESLLVILIRNQCMALTHRLDHYFYVHDYIHARPETATTAQRRSVATGGSQTTTFLPDLIHSNLIKAREYLHEYERIVERLTSATRSNNNNHEENTPNSSDESIEVHRQRIRETSATLERFEEHIHVLVKKGKTVEREEEEEEKGRERSVSM